MVVQVLVKGRVTRKVDVKKDLSAGARAWLAKETAPLVVAVERLRLRLGERSGLLAVAGIGAGIDTRTGQADDGLTHMPRYNKTDRERAHRADR